MQLFNCHTEFILHEDLKLMSILELFELFS